MTLPNFFQPCLPYVRKVTHYFREYWMYGVAVVVVSALGLVWYLPPAHHVLAQAAHTVLGDQPSPLVIPPATPDPRVESLAERTQQVEQALSALQQRLQQTDTQTLAMRDQYKAATDEVAQTNDALVKEQNELSTIISSLQSGGQKIVTATSAPTSATPTGKVNINTATAAQLDALPGIGPTYAQRIVDYRNQHGAFHTIDDLNNVSGIGPATVAKIKDLIEV